MKVKSKNFILVSLLLVLVLAGCTIPSIALESGQDEAQSKGQVKQDLKAEQRPDPTATPAPETSMPLDLLAGSVGDLVWEDLNGNGQQDEGEPGIPEVTVRMYDADQELVATTATNAEGFYLFEEIYAGEYFIEYLFENTLFTVQDTGGDDGSDSDADKDGLTSAFSLEPGEQRTNLDAGMVFPGHAAVCPFTGLPTDADLLDNRPIFISISHFPAWATRPATGLNSAPVVFETLIDEGQTRLQALFYCGYPEKLSEDSSGSDVKFDISGVRSGRVFYAELAQLFGAGLIFGGADPTVYQTIAPYQCGAVENQNIPSNIGGAGLNIESLEATAEKCQHRLGNPDFNVWQFGPAPAGGQAAKNFQMVYNYLNQTRWEYDPDAGGYVRYQNDPDSPEEFTLSTDRLTGEAVVRQNIILLETPHAVLNSSGTIIEFDLTDTRGYAWLLRDGAIYEACWSSVFSDYATVSNRYRPFLLYDCTTKEPIDFAYGSTWVNVVAPSFWFDNSGEYLVAKQPFLGYGE